MKESGQIRVKKRQGRERKKGKNVDAHYHLLGYTDLNEIQVYLQANAAP